MLGASASAAAEASEAETEEPDDTTADPDLLPGVNLATEEVAPGVYRVLTDGEHNLRTNVMDVTVTDAGDIWVLKGRPKGQGWVDQRALQLGEPGTSYDSATAEERPGFRPGGFFSGSDDSLLLVQGPYVIAAFNGRKWVEDRVTPFEACARGRAGSFPNSGVAADGACWYQENRSVGRVDAAGDRDSVTAPDLGFGQEHGLPRFAISDDGGLWALVADMEERRLTGVVAYDGQSWSTIPLDDYGTIDWADISVAPDDTVWVSATMLDGPGGLLIAIWDGEGWTKHGPLDVQPHSFWGSPDFLPDGSAWFGGATYRFDGTKLERIETGDPGLTFDQHPLVFDPSGTAWTVAGGGLYVIDPEAVTVTK